MQNGQRRRYAESQWLTRHRKAVVCKYDTTATSLSFCISFLPLGWAGQWPVFGLQGLAVGFLWWPCSVQPGIGGYSMTTLTVQCSYCTKVLEHWYLGYHLTSCHLIAVKWFITAGPVTDWSGLLVCSVTKDVVNELSRFHLVTFLSKSNESVLHRIMYLINSSINI